MSRRLPTLFKGLLLVILAVSVTACSGDDMRDLDAYMAEKRARPGRCYRADTDLQGLRGVRLRRDNHEKPLRPTGRGPSGGQIKRTLCGQARPRPAA